jgi:hypothetical protein
VNEDWIESKLRDVDIPPTGERRERTVALARAIAPEPRMRLRSRVAKPRVVVPLVALMIAAMTAPGQAATDEVSNFVARAVPIQVTQSATIAGPARNATRVMTAPGGTSIGSSGGHSNAFTRPARPAGAVGGTGCASSRGRVKPQARGSQTRGVVGTLRSGPTLRPVPTLRAVPDRTR